MARFSVAILLLGCALSALAATRLFLNEEGKFKIAQFTDLHFCLDDEDEQSQQVQRAVLDSEKPDLVVITGDAMSGSSLRDDADLARKEWRKTTEVISAMGYKWALAFGNHDDDGILKRPELIKMDMSVNGSLTQKGPDSIFGVANYYLPVFQTEQPVAGEVPAAILWVLSIQDFNCMGYPGDGCVTESQVKWFTQTSQSLKKQYGTSDLFSLVFFHTPTPEYVDIWNDEKVVGMKYENVSCPIINTGMYEAAYKEGASAMFVGHDHVNDYCGSFSDKPELVLCYGRKTGYGYYNPDPPMLHGSRMIEISKSGSSVATWKTWIRQQDGTIGAQDPHEPVGSAQAKCIAL